MLGVVWVDGSMITTVEIIISVNSNNKMTVVMWWNLNDGSIIWVIGVIVRCLVA